MGSVRNAASTGMANTINERPEMQDVTNRDPLTGVLSRAMLSTYLTQGAARAQKQGQPFSLMMLDLDHFKSVNDAFGYARGDQVLVEFSRRLAELLRPQDVLFRYGGDEFLILLPDTSKTQAARLANRLLAEIEMSKFSGNPPVTISASIGVASCPQDGYTAEALFEAADQHHYEAKRAGRSRVVEEVVPWQANMLPTEPPLLIERHFALDQLHQFLQTEGGAVHAICLIQGQAGSGKSRLLAEASKLGRLLGYLTLQVSGSTARSNRLFGALQDGRKAIEDLPDPLDGEERFIKAIKLALVQRKASGLLVLIDNVNEIDRLTLKFLRDWNQHLPQTRLRFVLAIPDGRKTIFQYKDNVQTVKLELLPLSTDGLRQWLENILGWDPSDEVLAWLYHQTGGWPGGIQAGLTYLLTQRLIYPDNGSWTYRPETTAIQLQEWLVERRRLPSNNLPEPLSELIDRQEELEALRRQLEANNLVVLHGPGGIGKTRLAQQVGLEMLEQFSDGVYFVALGEANGQSAAITAIADALDLRFYGLAPALTQLARYMRHRDMLLIMDNLEPQIDFTGLLVEITENAPGVKVLVTSRERLNAPGSVLFELDGFTCPDLSAEQEISSPAARLFLHTARRIEPTFQIKAEERPILAHICQLVDGLPLAIELAATWVTTFTLPEIAAEIEKSLDFLSTERKDVVLPHRRLAAIFDPFWNMLSEGEQRTLIRLAIFRGGFTQQSAAEIAEASPFFLDALVSRGFLRHMPPEYYELHELLRRYSLEKLRSQPEEYQHTRAQHAHYFMERLNQQRYAYARGILPVDKLAQPRENYRLAWSWVIDQSLVKEMGLGIDGYYAYLHLTGSFTEGRAAFTRALEMLADQQPETAELRRIICKLHIRLAGFLNKLGLFEEAIQHTRQGAELAQTLDDDQALAAAYIEWGEGLRYQGDFKTGRSLLNKALATARRREIPVMIADCLYSLGAIAHYLANMEAQRGYAEEALQISLANEDLRGQARAYNLLAIATEMEGRYSQAEAYYDRAIHLSRTTGDRLSESIPLINLASLLQLLGSYARARRVYEYFLEIKQELSDRPGEVWGLVYLSLLFHQLGNQNIAEKYARQALASAVEIGDRHNQATALTNLGHALLTKGDYAAAAKAYQEAQSIRQELEQERLAKEALAGRARTALASGKPAEARQYVDDILEFLEDNSLDGCDEPFRVWLTCWQVLEAVQDDRAAGVLERAYHLLDERSQQIQDTELRLSFLENVDAHRALADAWKLQFSGS